MNWQSIVGYALTAIVAPVVGYLLRAAPELAAALSMGVAGLGARLLHVAEPPAGKVPPGATPVALMLLALLPLAGCPRPGSVPGPNVVQCGTAAIESCASEVAGPVLDCFHQPSVGACLQALIKPTAACFGYGGVACAVGALAATSDLEVPTGRMVATVDEVVALRARAWLAEQRVELR